MNVTANADLLRAAANCATRDNNAFGCVYIEADQDCYRVVATDSYQLVEFKKTVDDSGFKEGNVLIRADLIKSLIKSSDKLAVISSDENRIICYGKNHQVTKEFTFTAEEYRFPNYKQLLKDFGESDKERASCLNPTLLEKVLKAAQIAFGKNHPLKINARERLFEFSTQYKNVSFRAILMSVRD